jgi:hypothetical protein
LPGRQAECTRAWARPRIDNLTPGRRSSRSDCHWRRSTSRRRAPDLPPRSCTRAAVGIAMIRQVRSIGTDSSRSTSLPPPNMPHPLLGTPGTLGFHPMRSSGSSCPRSTSVSQRPRCPSSRTRNPYPSTALARGTRPCQSAPFDRRCYRSTVARRLRGSSCPATARSTHASLVVCTDTPRNSGQRWPQRPQQE